MISWTWYGRVWNDNISDNGVTASESQVGGGGMGSIMFARERVNATGNQVRGTRGPVLSRKHVNYLGARP